MVEEFGGPDVYKSRLRPKARPLVAAPQSSWLPIGFMSGSSAPPAAAGAEAVRHASPVHLRNADRDVRRLSGGEPAPGAALGRCALGRFGVAFAQRTATASRTLTCCSASGLAEYTKRRRCGAGANVGRRDVFRSAPIGGYYIAVFDHDLTSEVRRRRRRLLLHLHPTTATTALTSTTSSTRTI